MSSIELPWRQVERTTASPVRVKALENTTALSSSIPTATTSKPVCAAPPRADRTSSYSQPVTGRASDSMPGRGTQ